MTIPHQFADVSVLCIGDVMLDRFVSGTVHRVSPESPVPVLSMRQAQLYPGGAANVARNIAALGGRCTLVGVVGDDAVGRELMASVAEIDGVTAALVCAEGRPTTEKVRFIAQGQHLLRVDQEDVSMLTTDLEQRLIERISALLEGHQVMVLSDYSKGVLTQGVVKSAIALARINHIPVIVDPKSPDMARYSGATIVTPNSKEVQAATGWDPTDDDALAVRAGAAILQQAALESVLVTRAHKGMTLVSRTAPPLHLPAHAREIFDVVGAGDTVVATLALAVGAGETLADAANMANVAAGIVVGKPGTATVSPGELARELTRVGAGYLAPLQDKIMQLSELLAQAREWRREGHAIGLVNGDFDPIEARHVALLSYARGQCGRLIVGLRSDDPAYRPQGAASAHCSGADRAVMLAGLSAVDAVVTFDSDAALELVRHIAPQVLVGDGGDGANAIDTIVGARLVELSGGRVLVAEAMHRTHHAGREETMPATGLRR